MSLNSAHANGGVLIFNGEMIVLYVDGVELQFDGPNVKEFGGTKKGRVYLTTHRMIFTNKSTKDPMQSFSFPFFSMKKIELEQPVFGANYIKGFVIAQQGGSWSGEAVFKLKFMTGGAIEYGQAMLQAAKMASRYMPPQPPPYVPQQGPYYPAPPPAYAPPAAGFNGFVPPTHVFPDSPPPNSVFMSNMAPPYPGFYPPPYNNYYPAPGAPQAPPPGYTAAGYQNGAPPLAGQQAPPPPGFANGYPPQGPSAPAVNYSKEQEAMASAYQSPYNPHDVFIPQSNSQAYPGQFDCAPPPYSEASKKNQ